MIDNVYLNALAIAHGARIESNTPEKLGVSPARCQRLLGKIGIHRRYVAGIDQYTSDLALDAARKLLADPSAPNLDVGALLVCTQTPDHLIPGVSSRLHGLLKLPSDCFVLDINQGCSGFVLGTQTVAGLLNTLPHGKSALLINADTYSRLIRPDDLTTRILFGDGASAAVFSNLKQGLHLRYVCSYADGAGYETFIAEGSALRPAQNAAPGIHMDGPGILNFALSVVPDAIGKALQATGLRIEQIREFVFHQANHFVTEHLTKKLGLSPEQVPENCAELGNTVSASIPMLLAERMPMLKPGDTIMVVGFGVGLSWGVAIFDA